jgi:hypothetical protein
LFGAFHATDFYPTAAGCVKEDSALVTLENDARAVIRSWNVPSDRLGRLWEAVEAAPKSRKWRRRARLGERMRWYQEPEEV